MPARHPHPIVGDPRSLATAFADAPSWIAVIERLQTKGVKVTAPPNPLRGIANDSAYAASLLAQMPGPILAVGHSYGGAVITDAASEADNVVGLVFVAAFAPEEGETLGEVEANANDSVLNSALVCPRGPSSPSAIRRPEPTSFARRRSEQAPRSPS